MGVVWGSVVVLEESPCLQGSSRTNFRVLVLVLVLGLQVLVHVLILEAWLLVLVLALESQVLDNNTGINHRNRSTGVDTAVSTPSHWKCIRVGENLGKLGEVKWRKTLSDLDNKLSLSFLILNDCAKFSSNSIQNCDRRSNERQTDRRLQRSYNLSTPTLCCI